MCNKPNKQTQILELVLLLPFHTPRLSKNKKILYFWALSLKYVQKLSRLLISLLFRNVSTNQLTSAKLRGYFQLNYYVSEFFIDRGIFMPNFASLSCFYSKLRWEAFLPPTSKIGCPNTPSKIGLKTNKIEVV